VQRLTQRPWAPLAAACLAGVLWGTGALVVDVLINRHDFTPESISLWRFAIGAVALLAVFGRRALGPAARAQAGLLIVSGACMALYVLAWFLGIAQIGAAIPTLIALCLPPVLVTLVAVLRGRESLDAPLAWWLVAALAGTGLIVSQHHGGGSSVGQGSLALGVAYAVASAVLYAAFSLVSGRLSSSLGSGASAASLTLVAALVMLATVAYEPVVMPRSPAAVGWLLYLGLVTASLALLAFAWGAARLSPTVLTVATLIEPLTAVLLAAWLLGERLSAWQWLGGGVLMLSIWCLGRRGTRALHP
jgi:DME family drug/metabolite transporter